MAMMKNQVSEQFILFFFYMHITYLPLLCEYSSHTPSLRPGYTQDKHQYYNQPQLPFLVNNNIIVINNEVHVVQLWLVSVRCC